MFGAEGVALPAQIWIGVPPFPLPDASVHEVFWATTKIVRLVVGFW